MEIYERLIKFFGKPSISYLSGSPFETLIRTIISQNTNWRNTGAAYKRLSEKFEIKPEVLAEVDIREIEKKVDEIIGEGKLSEIDLAVIEELKAEEDFEKIEEEIDKL